MDELRPGDELAGHRILGVAGRGGMGVVYRAQQLDLDRPVALKLIAGNLAADAAFRERFVRETRSAAAIDHPNVIPVYGAGEDAGRLYLAMRYVEGEDLRSRVQREGALDPEDAARLIAQVAGALDAAHARGLVHRDVKPANVLLDGDHAYLTDFGLTKRLTGETTMTGSGHWVGTLGYIAPEQIRGGAVDARADVYALGCLLFYALTGAAPYRRDSEEATLWAHLHEPPPDARDLEPAVPPALADVVRRALEKDPEDRFPSAGDLGSAALAAVGRGPRPGPERVVARGAAAPAGSDEETAVPDATAVQRSVTPTEVAPARRSPARGLLAPLAALLAGAAVVLAAAALLDGDPAERERRTATTGTTAAPGVRVAETVEVDGRPNALAYASGRVWVSNPQTNRLLGLPAGGDGPPAVVRLPGGRGASSVTAAFGSLWVTTARRHQLLEVDPVARRVVRTIPLPEGDVAAAVAGGRALWVVRRQVGDTPPDSLLRVDPRSGRVVKELVFGEEGIRNIDAGGGFVWITNSRRDRLSRVRISTGDRQSETTGRQPRGVAYADGAVWVANYDDGTVLEVTAGLRRRGLQATGAGPVGVAISGDVVWVGNLLGNTVVRLDRRTGRLLGAPIEVGRNPYAILARGDTAWVTNLGDGTVSRIEAR